ncbi:MAG: isocitrate/isopropylmalate dehydrogenase family protein [Methanotrichaceae archaeon]|nr:isocitrate/isopropylmalate dehydrogenase family protein [Methanotrichaceae archaeon]
MSGKRTPKVALVPGDGIGPEVIESALAVLQAAGGEIEAVPFEVGLGRWKRTGTALSEEDLIAIKDLDCVLFGAITTPPDPAYKSVLLRLRKELDLYANIRPFKGQRLNLVIVRENTEGLYSGIETIEDEEARTVRLITRRGSRRIAEKACDLAKERQKLTVVHKSNVLKSDRLFLKVCREVALKRGVPHDDMYVDAAAYNLIVRPEAFDVLVTTNLFGDILSDEAAGILGSLGLCASANLGDDRALFEPIHGSAPDIAGKGIANPIGAIRSTAMMMQWLGRPEVSQRMEDAVSWALQTGMTTTDLGGSYATREVTEALALRLTDMSH